MVRIIEVDLDSKYEYINKYDDTKLNDSLLEYILNSYDDVKDDVSLHVKFNYEVSDEVKDNVDLVFKSSFEKSLLNLERDLSKLRVRNFILMFLGFLFLAIYCLLDSFNIFLFSELFLVISWVAFWEMAEGFLFNDKKLIITKKKYQRLLVSKIIII